MKITKKADKHENVYATWDKPEMKCNITYPKLFEV